MFIVITYDIIDDKRRTKIAKTLKDYGTRVQYSVFECNVTDKQFVTLRKKLAKYIGDGDGIRYYKLCGSCVERIEFDGEGTVTRDEQYYVV